MCVSMIVYVCTLISFHCFHRCTDILSLFVIVCFHAIGQCDNVYANSDYHLHLYHTVICLSHTKRPCRHAPTFALSAKASLLYIADIVHIVQ